MTNEVLPIYEPTLEPYKTSVYDAIESGWISCHGVYKDKTATLLKKILKVKHVLLTCNGTAATHCLFLALQFRYPHLQKIYVPNHVYIAAINSALFEYPLSMLEMVETDEETWNMRTDPEYIMRLEPHAALLVVHNLGNIVNVLEIQRLRPDLIVVEDNCEGLFGTYEGTYAGCSKATLCASVSFFGNKTITSGEGGAVLIPEDDGLAAYLSRKISQGMTEKRYVHDMVAYNYRMTNVAAAFLYDQLSDMDSIRNKKERVIALYKKFLCSAEESGDIAFQKIDPQTTHSTWMFALRIFGNPDYETFQKFMKERGVDTRPFFYALFVHQHLCLLPSQNPQHALSQTLENEIALLPSYPSLTEKQIEHICNVVLEYLQFVKEVRSFVIQKIRGDFSRIQAFWDTQIPQGRRTFRYFDSREVDVCENHLLTIVVQRNGEEEAPIGYGHLDPEGGRVWLGICVADRWQGKGMGTKIMKYLLRYMDERGLDTHLTVDKDNTCAIHLYRSHGFEVEKELSAKFWMKRVCPSDEIAGKPAPTTDSILSLPVSIGEAVDKYTILQIKEEKIAGTDRLKEVKREKDTLTPHLTPILEKYPHYVNVLRQINQEIWEDQDRFRASSDPEEQARICLKIIRDNDGRFRVKKKLNALASSTLKEQKSYTEKKCLLLGHLGMGDMFTMIGATRYLAIYYDHVLVVVKKMYEEPVRSMYADDPSIAFLVVEEDNDISPLYGASPEILEKYEQEGYEVLRCGLHKSTHLQLQRFYQQFYEDIGLDWRIRELYGHINRYPEQEKRCFSQITRNLSDPNPRIIFVHDRNPYNISDRLLETECLVFNVNRNAYEAFPDHPYHSVWQESFSLDPVVDYATVLEHAEEIHLMDSAFFCLATYLNLDRVKRLVVYQRQDTGLHYDMKHYIPMHQSWEIQKL